jgi:hypothetical protein
MSSYKPVESPYWLEYVGTWVECHLGLKMGHFYWNSADWDGQEGSPKVTGVNPKNKFNGTTTDFADCSM